MDERPDEHDAAVWRENVKCLLDSYSGSVRSRQGGGAENLIESLCITFFKISDQLGKRTAEVDELKAELVKHEEAGYLAVEAMKNLRRKVDTLTAQLQAKPR